jgi:hypothetical protein
MLALTGIHLALPGLAGLNQDWSVHGVDAAGTALGVCDLHFDVLSGTNRLETGLS